MGNFCTATMEPDLKSIAVEVLAKNMPVKRMGFENFLPAVV